MAIETFASFPAITPGIFGSRKSCSGIRRMGSSSEDIQRIMDHGCISFRCGHSFSGSLQPHFSTPREFCPAKVRVAGDYSCSMPNSPKWRDGYHPLEAIRESETRTDWTLSSAQIAKTTVESNRSALLVFPWMAHREPHRHTSWAEFHYVVDDYGDIFFEIFDDENIMKDHGANNSVNVFIGMDIPQTGGNRKAISYYLGGIEPRNSPDIYYDANQAEDATIPGTSTDWGLPKNFNSTHPLYFARCMEEASHVNYKNRLDHPSNGVSIIGSLRPALIGEEYYLRKNFLIEDDYNSISDWIDEPKLGDEQVAAIYDLIGSPSSRLYKLEIFNIELFSVYGYQSSVDLQDFQDVESDVLLHSAPSIVTHFSEYGNKFSSALKSLCLKRKGLKVGEATMIGVDSLGIDVRVFTGIEARTMRFSFNSRAMNEKEAEKKIQRMLFPRYNRSKNVSASRDVTRKHKSSQ